MYAAANGYWGTIKLAVASIWRGDRPLVGRPNLRLSVVDQFRREALSQYFRAAQACETDDVFVIRTFLAELKSAVSYVVMDEKTRRVFGHASSLMGPAG